MWPWKQKNSVVDIAQAEQPAEPAISHAADATLTRIQLARLRKILRVVDRIRTQDERCRLSLGMSARQGFRPEVDRAESLRLRRLVEEYITLVARAKDEVGLEIEKHLAPADQGFIHRVLEDHHHPVTTGPLPVDVQLFLESGVDITLMQPVKKQTTYGDGLDQLLK